MKLIQVVRYLRRHSQPVCSATYCSARFFTMKVNVKTPLEVAPFRTYQEMVYFYLTEKKYWKSAVNKLLTRNLQKEPEFKEIDNYFMNKNVIVGENENSTSALALSKLLPSYIATMKSRDGFPSNQIVTMCDAYCSEIFDLHFSTLNPSRKSSFEFIHAWLYYFHPDFINMQQLTCFGKLLQWRCREILSDQGNRNDAALPDKLVHLAFLAALGKKSFDSHEILNQLATFCDMNNEITYKALTPFDMAILCECFFKGGIRIEAEKSLSSIATTLCSFLHQTLQLRDQPSQHFNPFVIISLLKVLRQVNFIDGELLKLLSELILHPLCGEKVRDIRFIINVAGAFSFPGCQKIYPSSSLEKLLNRMDNLVLKILQEEEQSSSELQKRLDFVGSEKKDAQVLTSIGAGDSAMVVESRLKDVSKWLWITASLGYHLPSPETYIKDLHQRLDKGQFTKKPEDGIDSLLALAITNQYPDSSQVLKILQSTDFRSSVKVNCSNRHKGRLGLFLTSLRIERASIWNQLSSKEENHWFEAVRTPFTMTESNAWSQIHRKVKPLRVPGIRNDFKPQTQLLNACMDAMNQIFSQNIALPAVVSTKLRDHDKADYNSTISRNKPIKKSGSGSSSSARLISLLLESEIDVPYQTQRAQVHVGYAVPFLFIPGLKILFPITRKEVYLEVLDDVGLSSSYHSFKMRLMEKLQCTYVKVTRDEIQDLDNAELINLLKLRIKDIS